MRRKNLIFILLFLVLLFFSAATLYFFIPKTKSAYVDINLLYEQFEYKQELEEKLNQTKISREKSLDSLKFILNDLSKSLENKNFEDKSLLNEFNQKRELYLMLQKQNEEANIAQATSYDQLIFKQINQYVKDYGEKNGYTYIYGTSGNGNIMYAKPNKDITKKLIIYTNERYNGVSQ